MSEPDGESTREPETEAEFLERLPEIRAAAEAKAEQMARLTPVTDAEIERYGGEPEAADTGADRAAVLEEIRAEVDAISARVDEIPDPAAERRAEMDQAGIDEPVAHERQAGPSLEASWQPGNAQGYSAPQADQDAEPEMEIG